MNQFLFVFFFITLRALHCIDLNIRQYMHKIGMIYKYQQNRFRLFRCSLWLHKTPTFLGFNVLRRIASLLCLRNKDGGDPFKRSIQAVQN